MGEKRSWRSTGSTWLYLFPAFLIIAVFCLYPVVKSFDLSLYVRYDYYRNIVYERGLHNFNYVIHDPEFWLAMRNTFILVVTVVPLSMTLSLGIAYFLHAGRTAARFIQTAIFLPLVVSILAVALSWRWMFHTEYGIVNAFLGWLGLSPIGWLTSPEWVLPSLILFSIWHSLGYNVLLFLIGLQAIPSQFDRAARVDGAAAWQRFKRVTLPLLRPVFFYVSIVSVIHAFMTFDEVFALFGGSRAGPMDRGLTVVYYIFRKFYSEAEYGIASASAYVLFVIVFALTAIQLKLNNKRSF